MPVADPASAATADAERVRLTVLSRGSARVQLRNAFTAGSTSQGTMEMTQSVVTYANGTQVSSVDVPLVRTGVALTVEKVSTEGNARRRVATPRSTWSTTVRCRRSSSSSCGAPCNR